MKEVPGFEGQLKINEVGEVWAYPVQTKWKRGKYGKFLQPRIESMGYWSISYRKAIRVHRLLALTFIPNPLNLPEVNHKNGIKTDNRLENLEWCTHRKNIQHAASTGLLGQGKLNAAKVKEIRGLYASGRFSMRGLGKKYGVDGGRITRIVNNKIWTEVACYSNEGTQQETDMLYVCVSDRRLPNLHGYPRRCAFCTEPIGDSYVREVSTKLPYCQVEHFWAHCMRAETLLLEHSA